MYNFLSRLVLIMILPFESYMQPEEHITCCLPASLQCRTKLSIYFNIEMSNILAHRCVDILQCNEMQAAQTDSNAIESVSMSV